MKILHVINHFQPSLGYQETFLARIQKAAGHDVRVVTSDRYSPILVGLSVQHTSDRKMMQGKRVENGIEVVRLRTFLDVPVGNFALLKGLEREIRAFNPDAVHVHGVMNVTALRIARMKGNLGRVVMLFDDHMTFNATRGITVRPFYWFYRTFLSRVIESNSDSIVAVTEETRRLMVEWYGISAERICVIPLGCDTDIFKRCESSRRRLRRRYSINDTTVVFCNAGKFMRRKGVHLLIEVALDMLRDGRDIAVLCVGGRDQRYFESALSMIEDSPFRSRFIFVPSVPNSELPDYYSMADVGVWPLQCSVTMLEAMACGLPVIASDRCGATERINGLGNGLLYRESDKTNLKLRMEALLDSRTRNDMSDKARAYAESVDWKVISREFERLYCGGQPMQGVCHGRETE